MESLIFIICLWLFAGWVMGRSPIPKGYPKTIFRLMTWPFALYRRLLWDSPKETKGVFFAVLVNLIVWAGIITLYLGVLAPQVLAVVGVWAVVFIVWILYKKKPSNRPRRLPGRSRR